MGSNFFLWPISFFLFGPLHFMFSRRPISFFFFLLARFTLLFQPKPCAPPQVEAHPLCPSSCPHYPVVPSWHQATSASSSTWIPCARVQARHYTAAVALVDSSSPCLFKQHLHVNLFTHASSSKTLRHRPRGRPRHAAIDRRTAGHQSSFIIKFVIDSASPPVLPLPLGLHRRELRGALSFIT